MANAITMADSNEEELKSVENAVSEPEHEQHEHGEEEEKPSESSPSRSKQAWSAPATAAPSPSFPEGEHPLQSAWCFWYDKKYKAHDAADFQAQLHRFPTFNTVESFWRYYVHLKRPSQLQKDTNLYMFREGHKPMWEEHPEGGCWILKIKKKHGVLGKMWQDLLIAAIGEVFEEPDVVGIALAIRSKEDLISVWNADNSNEETRFLIGLRLKEILQLDPNTLMEYKFHKQSLKDLSTFRNAKPYVFAATQ